MFRSDSVYFVFEIDFQMTTRLMILIWSFWIEIESLNIVDNKCWHFGYKNLLFAMLTYDWTSVIRIQESNVKTLESMHLTQWISAQSNKQTRKFQWLHKSHMFSFVSNKMQIFFCFEPLICVLTRVTLVISIDFQVFCLRFSHSFGCSDCCCCCCFWFVYVFFA